MIFSSYKSGAGSQNIFENAHNFKTECYRCQQIYIRNYDPRYGKIAVKIANMYKKILLNFWPPGGY